MPFNTLKKKKEKHDRYKKVEIVVGSPSPKMKEIKNSPEKLFIQ